MCYTVIKDSPVHLFFARHNTQINSKHQVKSTVKHQTFGKNPATKKQRINEIQDILLLN